MCGHPRKNSAGAFLFKPALSKTPGGTDCFQAESGKHKGVKYALWSQGSCRELFEFIPVGHEWRHQFAVCLCITTQPCSSRFHRILKHDGRAVIQRMRECRRWIDHFQAILLKRQVTEKR